MENIKFISVNEALPEYANNQAKVYMKKSNGGITKGIFYLNGGKPTFASYGSDISNDVIAWAYEIQPIPKAEKLIEHTYGNHIYMKMKLDNNRIEEIDVFLRDSGTVYRTSADYGSELDQTEEQKQKRNELRNKIIQTFNELY